jgi:engulfment/cell motility protein 1
VDSAVKFPVRNGLEDLPERIDISLVSEIATGTCGPPPNVLRDHSDLPPTSPLVPSELSFSLLSAHDGSLADQIAPDQSRWADWTDGLNMLRRDSGHVTSQETAGFVQALTEIGLKIKLLGGFHSFRRASLALIPFLRSIRRKGRDTQWVGDWSPTHKYGIFLLRTDVM